MRHLKRREIIITSNCLKKITDQLNSVQGHKYRVPSENTIPYSLSDKNTQYSIVIVNQTSPLTITPPRNVQDVKIAEASR